MSLLKLKIGDEVSILTGKDRYKMGRILKINRFRQRNGKEQLKVMVEGMNKILKSVRRDPQAQESGGLRPRENWMDASNVLLRHPKTDKPTRVGFKIVDGKKVRFFKSDGQIVVDAEKVK